jgi:hypothetical protein
VDGVSAVVARTIKYGGLCGIAYFGFRLVIPVLGLAVVSAISVKAAIAMTRFVPGRGLIDRESLAMGQ